MTPSPFSFDGPCDVPSETVVAAAELLASNTRGIIAARDLLYLLCDGCIDLDEARRAAIVTLAFAALTARPSTVCAAIRLALQE